MSVVRERNKWREREKQRKNYILDELKIASLKK
jgi:hypothetical protein